MDHYCPNSLDAKIKDTMAILREDEETYCSHNEVLGDKGRLPSRARNDWRAEKGTWVCFYCSYKVTILLWVKTFFV